MNVRLDDGATVRRAPETVAAMRRAALAFLDALDDRQRATATAPFDTPDFTEWTYVPGPRPGLTLEDMSGPQRERAFALLDTGLSEAGAATAREIIALENDLAAVEAKMGRSVHRRDPQLYYFRVLGDPAGDGPWAWRANGHHLAVHVTAVGEAISVTPQFFGANPARVPFGAREGHRTLPAEEDLARDLLARFDDDRLTAVIVDPIAPDDIRTRFDPVANFEVVPAGLRFDDMTGDQQEGVVALIELYLGRVTPPAADASRRLVEQAGLADVTFAWAGSTEVGRGHYYSVRGPNFLLEYDNTQNNANHIHTVWRDRLNDWGKDLLAAHYASGH